MKSPRIKFINPLTMEELSALGIKNRRDYANSIIRSYNLKGSEASNVLKLYNSRVSDDFFKGHGVKGLK